MTATLLCFSHLRWNFVYQRPQHLMSRFARHGKVYFIEEPLFDTGWRGYQAYKPEGHMNVTVLVPHLPGGLSTLEKDARLNSMLHSFLDATDVQQYVSWYYSPMSLSFTSSLAPLVTVYDCMDELSAFKFAPAELREREARLFSQADVVFTGGNNLFDAKKSQHHNIRSYPSSIDREHFARARESSRDPEDQHHLPHPRLGYYGVIDERIDLALLEEVATQRPEWQIVLVGPVVKIDPETLPRLENIHYLGQKNYHELPEYLGSWDIAIMPFALNDSTRFISPTKTPEYLAGGKYVISTPITDVVNDYGKEGLVCIGNSATEFIGHADRLLSISADERSRWLGQVDRKLADNSWDKTWQSMSDMIDQALDMKTAAHHKFLQTCSITL